MASIDDEAHEEGSGPTGRQGQPFRMVVELGKLREFARATKSQNPEYLSGEHPVSPTTFLASSGFWQDAAHSPVSDAVPASYERMLHGGQEFVFTGEPPRAGTVLVGQTRIGDTYEKTGRRGGVMKFTESVTEYRDEEGRLVAESRSTIIETSQPPTPVGGA